MTITNGHDLGGARLGQGLREVSTDHRPPVLLDDDLSGLTPEQLGEIADRLIADKGFDDRRTLPKRGVGWCLSGAKIVSTTSLEPEMFIGGDRVEPSDWLAVVDPDEAKMVGLHDPEGNIVAFYGEGDSKLTQVQPIETDASRVYFHALADLLG